MRLPRISPPPLPPPAEACARGITWHRSAAGVALRPSDMARIASLDAWGHRDRRRAFADFVSRFFAPQAGVPEDPRDRLTHCADPVLGEAGQEPLMPSRSPREAEFFCERTLCRHDRRLCCPLPEERSGSTPAQVARAGAARRSSSERTAARVMSAGRWRRRRAARPAGLFLQPERLNGTTAKPASESSARRSAPRSSRRASPVERVRRDRTAQR
jgi:hypothetical protein